MTTIKVWRGDIKNLQRAIGKRYTVLKNPEPSSEAWQSRFTKDGKILKTVLEEPFSFEFLTVQIEE